MRKVGVGVIGCGNISSIYLKNLQLFKNIELLAVADLDLKRAKAQVEAFNVPAVLTPAQLLKNKDIKIVVNLTIPKAHKDVALAAIRAGKSVYNEKPLAVTRKDAAKIIAAAKKKGVLVGCAPDTFLGAGIQTCRKIIEEGKLGRPVAATAFMVCAGHESWHPAPEFYYQKGGGPMLDMGPYYVTALVNLLGPAKRVTGSAQISFKERLITSQPKHGKKIKVEVPTHVAGVIDFKNGAVATIITSFDIKAAGLPIIEIYCENGTLSVPDPNSFNGPVKIKKWKQTDWTEVPLSFGYSDNSRGLGVSDMAAALLSRKKHRASGELAYHVLDVMESLHEASAKGKHIVLKSTCAKPEQMKAGLKQFELE